MPHISCSIATLEMRSRPRPKTAVAANPALPQGHLAHAAPPSPDMQHDVDLRYFLLVTEPNGEFRARNHLRSLGFDPYVPAETITRNRVVRTMFGTRQRSYRIEQPIFRGYLLLPLNMAWSFGPLYQTPGLRARPFLQRAGQPVTMPDHEIELMRKIEHALAHPEQPVLPFRPGDRVKIVEGPFIEQVGIVKRLDKDERVELLLHGLGRAFVHAYQIVKP